MCTFIAWVLKVDEGLGSGVTLLLEFLIVHLLAFAFFLAVSLCSPNVDPNQRL